MPDDGGVFSSDTDLVFPKGVGVSEPALVGLCSGVCEDMRSSHSASLEVRNPFSGDRRYKESLNLPGEAPVCTLCIRRWCGRIMPFSGDGGGLLVYALGALSRARDAINAAAFSIFDETLAFVIGLLLAVGLSGNGGGALSGSELSHL